MSVSSNDYNFHDFENGLSKLLPNHTTLLWRRLQDMFLFFVVSSLGLKGCVLESSKVGG